MDSCIGRSKICGEQKYTVRMRLFGKLSLRPIANLNTIFVPAQQTQPIRMEFASALQTWCLWATSFLYTFVTVQS